MSKLTSIVSFPEDAIDLLEAVGYMDTQDLCDADARDLTEEMIKANNTLEIMSESPTFEQCIEWQSLAREADGSTYVAPSSDAVTDNESSSASSVRCYFEADPEVQSMLEVSPFADPVSAELIKRYDLAVGDIAEGILLTECRGDVKINVLTTQGLVKRQEKSAEIKRSGLMTSRIRSFDEAETEDHHVKPLDKGTPRDIVSSSEGLNAGLTPDSRRFVRGVLHPDPWSVRVSAFFAVLVQSLLGITVLAVPSLILYDLTYDVPESMWWAVGLGGGLFVAALCYLFWGVSARCRVCGQRQFAPKKCLKNRKAHHIALIGYIFPTALHAMFYKWFYCTYCGTAVRLKK